jgi:23S rRNA (uracil1939-C5)-methyltransferase
MRRKARKGGGKQIEATIESLGGRGDGVTSHHGQPVFAPFALPGERVRLRLVGKSSAGVRGEVLEILDESPDRVAPPCAHFGPCGGCTVQHLADPAYRRWTREQVEIALRRRGFTAPPVAEPVFVGRKTRRRATLAATRRGKQVAIGFHGRETHRVEDIHACEVLAPEILALLPPLRSALGPLLDGGETADVTVLSSDGGLDVLLASRAPPNLKAREALADLAQQADLARLAWTEAGRADPDLPPEPIAVRRPPLLHFAEVPVEPPPGGFVQPTAEGEAALIDAVRGWLDDARGPVADLYAGVGTFTFPLARGHKVHAVEGDQAAMAALWQSARRNDLMGRVTAEVRDLALEPLAGDDLDGVDGVVFDPPRAGAKAQAEALAESDVATVVAVSCNPNTFGRDARALVDGGYRLVEVRPVDQFPWTGHVELAALFRR